MTVHLVWLSVIVVSFTLVWVTLRLATKHQLLDIPNERSSHDRPVPRGGGIAIILAFNIGLVIAWYLDFPVSLTPAVLVGGALVGLVGAADDYRHIRAGWRLLVHCLVVGWTLYSLGGISSDVLPGVPQFLHNLFAFLCAAWLISLFNFMDGIDGIAGIEAVTVCFGGLVVLSSLDYAESTWVPSLILLAASGGFLFWNFPGARIFMGDSGSGFLGFMMAVFCIRATHLDPDVFWAWIILLGVFITDSGITLARRIARRARLHEAHRSHGYQIAARRFGAHAPVSLAVGAINLFWLLPLAYIVASDRAPAAPVLLVAFAPLFWLASRFEAGKK